MFNQKFHPTNVFSFFIRSFMGKAFMVAYLTVLSLSFLTKSVVIPSYVKSNTRVASRKYTFTLHVTVLARASALSLSTRSAQGNT